MKDKGTLLNKRLYNSRGSVGSHSSKVASGSRAPAPSLTSLSQAAQQEGRSGPYRNRRGFPEISKGPTFQVWLSRTIRRCLQLRFVDLVVFINVRLPSLLIHGTATRRGHPARPAIVPPNNYLFPPTRPGYSPMVVRAEGTIVGWESTIAGGWPLRGRAGVVHVGDRIGWEF